MIASHRWLGRRPEGPGSEATGKDFIPFRIPASVRDTGGGGGPLEEAQVRPLEVRDLMALE